jgi:putative colanic acid biosynthesis acetyltransferase WcaF
MSTSPQAYRHGFTVCNRLRRLMWKVVERTLFRLSPAPLHAWRCWLLRCFGAVIDSTAHVYPTVSIWAPWNLAMGAHSCLSWSVDCYSVDRITLRAGAIVSQHARLVSASHDIRDPAFPLVHAPIELGPASWVCAYSYVGMGLQVGEGAIVAATATVTIVAGNPSRVIGVRHIRSLAEATASRK